MGERKGLKQRGREGGTKGGKGGTSGETELETPEKMERYSGARGTQDQVKKGKERSRE